MRIVFLSKRLWQAALLFAAILILWCGYALYHINQVEQTATARKADVAIVLGAAVWGEEPSPGLRERLDQALWLYDNHYVPMLLVSGGLGDGKKITEAAAMKRYLVEHGVPEERILLESQARSTFENLAFSKPIMAEHGLRSALIVSHGFHLARALDMAETLDMTAYPVGTASRVLVIPYHKAREVLAFTKWKLDSLLGANTLVNPFAYPFILRLSPSIR